MQLAVELTDDDLQVTRRGGVPLQVAAWLQACHEAGIAVRVQINKSAAPADVTDTWYRRLDKALQAQGITGLNEEIRQAVILPGEALRDLPAPARLLDELERRQLYCNREQLAEIVFSPVRKPRERWTERLQWLLMTDGFGFCSPLSRDAGVRALAILAGYTGQEVRRIWPR
ncbi:hypothetical protein ACWKX9_23150 [Enterobacter asburiae]